MPALSHGDEIFSEGVQILIGFVEGDVGLHLLEHDLQEFGIVQDEDGSEDFVAVEEVSWNALVIRSRSTTLSDSEEEVVQHPLRFGQAAREGQALEVGRWQHSLDVGLLLSGLCVHDVFEEAVVL